MKPEEETDEHVKFSDLVRKVLKDTGKSQQYYRCKPGSRKEYFYNSLCYTIRLLLGIPCFLVGLACALMVPNKTIYAPHLLVNTPSQPRQSTASSPPTPPQPAPVRAKSLVDIITQTSQITKTLRSFIKNPSTRNTQRNVYNQILSHWLHIDSGFSTFDEEPQGFKKLALKKALEVNIYKAVLDSLENAKNCGLVKIKRDKFYKYLALEYNMSTTYFLQTILLDSLSNPVKVSFEEPSKSRDVSVDMSVERSEGSQDEETQVNSIQK